MTRARLYTPQEDRFIRESFHAGRSNAWIGEQTGRSHNSIARRLSELGVSGRHEKMRRPRGERNEAEIYEPPHVISCNQAKWDVAWAAFHGTRRYADALVRESVGLREVRTSYIGDATLGGVATGML